MQVCPKNHSVDPIGYLQHVMMVVPVNPDHHKAEHVSQKYREKRPYRLDIRPVRDLELQHENRDQYRKHAVAEGDEPLLRHSVSSAVAHEWQM